MKKLVVLTGSGISAESGIPTFRDMGGIWEQYNFVDVASPEAWHNNPELVLRFYNERRKKVIESEPNQGHRGLVELEKYFDVQIITQNVDDLHERAGSKNILHLHGEIRKSRSTADSSLIYTIRGWELNPGDKCEKGSQLRPHIVWFGESVPAISKASHICEKADIFVVIGTSLNVYPAAGLIDYVPLHIPIYLIDPNEINLPAIKNLICIKEKACTGVQALINDLKNKYLFND
ncbi:MAG: NAD-dependent protein deacylase [Bacteroidetes bacterium GWC2_33_15]|nr:MAG: NAD-dependent protein deacylase [Bacteroidetes bacterium GWA2_33_15]OFX49367.1 MAG: NAD-dependent protein deacylase [Bacteroidetes bacterium GWC2_33_15]OFX63041.1 MAG: NAD-dependent protein deacylase [Bacteroidetes bacterium GWB2_32_14]OFX68714.1 MAG: NAD-dependent protein deacylase [Bacteroidetes bacterium GWD2_33_33]HAN19118.1 NAD-dependent protein deacylase [Bacteroidales bacterium]